MTSTNAISFRHWLVWLAMVSVAGCGGCGNRDAETGDGEANVKPYAGMAIDVAIPAGQDLAADWELPLTEWGVQNGAECRLREYTLPQGDAKFLDALQKPMDEMPEVMFIPWSAVPELMAGEALADIPEAVQLPEQLHWLDIFPALRNRAAKVARKPRLVPVSAPILVCYYRQDLLEKANLTPPQTWSDYQSLLETLDDWAPGLSAVEPWGEEFRVTMFLARSAAIAKHPEQLSFCFRLSDADPLIDNPGFAESLKLAKSALGLMPEKVKTYSPADCRREILAGRAALAIGYETRKGEEEMRADDVQIGICPLPGANRVYNTAIDDWVEFNADEPHRVTLTGFDGWAIAVASHEDAKLKSAAWEIARTMAVDQFPASYPPQMVSLCRDSHLATPAAWTGSQLTSLESEQYVSTVGASLKSDQVVMEFPLLGSHQLRAALTEGLTRALAQIGDEESILQQVAEDWRQIIERIGQEAVAKSHQRSHE